MRSVMGIDAAWTQKNPSGVSLVVETLTGWRLVRVEQSYGRFQMCSRVGSMDPNADNSIFDVSKLLDTCSQLHGTQVDLIAVDMPLSLQAILSRRVADNAVSKAYGMRKCSTHSPTASRPGALSVLFTESFAAMGYPLQTRNISSPGLIEVYPHPALVELMEENERLKYKLGKGRAYWPKLDRIERRLKLLDEWDRIVIALQEKIEGVRDHLPRLNLDASTVALKSFEDKLDAVICAWIGIVALNGDATPYGDEEAAIWIPSPKCRSQISTR